MKKVCQRGGGRTDPLAVEPEGWRDRYRQLITNEPSHSPFLLFSSPPRRAANYVFFFSCPGVQDVVDCAPGLFIAVLHVSKCGELFKQRNRAPKLKQQACLPSAFSFSGEPKNSPLRLRFGFD